MFDSKQVADLLTAVAGNRIRELEDTLRTTMNELRAATQHRDVNYEDYIGLKGYLLDKHPKVWKAFTVLPKEEK